MYRLTAAPATSPVAAKPWNHLFGNFAGVQTANCFHKVWAVRIHPLTDTDEDVKAARDAAHSRSIYDLEYVPAPHSGQFTEPLDAAQISALWWLQGQAFPGRHDCNWYPWPRALRDAFLKIDLTRKDIWMLAAFFWNLGVDRYHVALWFSTRGAFPRMAGPGENAILAEKRGLFMDIYDVLDSLCPDRPMDQGDIIACWAVRDLQFQRYVAECAPKAPTPTPTFTYDHCHESQTCAEMIQVGDGIVCPLTMHAPWVRMDDPERYIYPDPKKADSWNSENE
jgi:hypothetical protein